VKDTHTSHLSFSVFGAQLKCWPYARKQIIKQTALAPRHKPGQCGVCVMWVCVVSAFRRGVGAWSFCGWATWVYALTLRINFALYKFATHTFAAFCVTFIQRVCPGKDCEGGESSQLDIVRGAKKGQVCRGVTADNYNYICKTCAICQNTYNGTGWQPTKFASVYVCVCGSFTCNKNKSNPEL